jgi:hypothetical protein
LSIKNDIQMVKEELNSEEKFFEKAVMTERFVKKYKGLMIGSVVAVVFFVAGNIAYTINEQNTLKATNKALNELQINPANSVALDELKSLSPVLSDAWLYSQAIAQKDIASLEKLKNSESPLIGDLASYELAQNSADVSALNAYSSKQDAVYRDLAQVLSAVKLINTQKIDEAQRKLSMISVDSPLSQVAKALMHYGVK